MLKKKHLILSILIITFVILHTGSVFAGQNAVCMDPEEVTISVGQTIQLKMTIGGGDANSVASDWKSTNSSVAAVSPTGLVKGISAGTADVSCDTSYGFRVSCSLTVTGRAAETKPTKPEDDPQTGTEVTPTTGTQGNTQAGTETNTQKTVKKTNVESYLSKSYRSLIKRVPTAVHLKKAKDPAGIGNVYVFEKNGGTSLFLRYNPKTKKITTLQNDTEKKLVLYGVKLGMTEKKAKAALKKNKWKYKGKAKGGGGYWLNYQKKSATVRLLIIGKKVSCYQWQRG